MPAQSFQIAKRPSSERGHADHGWLNTYHTFSFADYYDPKYQEFGALRVLNEDRVKARRGFGTHPHRQYEIFSYIISGELEHKDSMGNIEVLQRGDVQFTTAGTGISHSEKNEHPSKPVHFLQIWTKPENSYLEPGYVTRRFQEADKRNRLQPFVSPYQDVVNALTTAETPTVLPDTIGIHTDLYAYSSILEPGQTVVHQVVKSQTPGSATRARRVYLHVIDKAGSLDVADGQSETTTRLDKGDGAFITEVKPSGTIELANPSDKPVEFILFDLA
ncbi:hypothetical protein H4R33_001395 [Dimargaris cristalligena]|uniref:RmlC-like cupin domain-containing protein n=1 Tax=Dimargaris cristalligena TaxID=215637 RepID=A0A4P9ZW45_9FUNG|nr:hypothetical protein H4R33_001395 [Dimargaris cristalligena]RKP37518.1 RmlC-like cupin domain-containing protein [Dimargaris cristalligena]|eukprot:RKP37518.1 RmlC-like cupin domain-containing protein [Dimargaris cristalligena]